MKLKDIIKRLEVLAPAELAESWDNVGLMIGDEEAEIKNACVCLDVTDNDIDFAIENKCSLIVTHHPFILPYLKNLSYENPKSKMIVKLIKNDIAVYSMHTNFDSAVGGINDILCRLFNIKPECEGEIGIFRKGTFEKDITLGEFVENVKEKLGVNRVLVCGDMEKTLHSCGVCSGGGGSFINEACPCDVFLTGEAKYHEFQGAYENGVAVIAAGHFETEDVALEDIRDILKGCDINVLKNNIKGGFYNIV